jgi:hypothetical protein
MEKIAKLKTANWKSEKWKRNSSNGKEMRMGGGVPVTV